MPISDTPSKNLTNYFDVIDSIRKISRSIGILALVAGAASCANVAEAQKTGDRHKDWNVRCEKPAETVPEKCFIYQTLVNQDDKPVLQVTIGYLGENNQPVAVFTLPLGVSLRAGVDVKVDQQDLFRIPYERCAPNGCIAGIQLTDQHIARLKAGSKGQVLVHDGRRQIPLEISLSGFTAGFNVLR